MICTVPLKNLWRLFQIKEVSRWRHIFPSLNHSSAITHVTGWRLAWSICCLCSVVSSPPPLYLLWFSRSWCTGNWIWEESFNCVFHWHLWFSCQKTNWVFRSDGTPSSLSWASWISLPCAKLSSCTSVVHLSCPHIWDFSASLEELWLQLNVPWLDGSHRNSRQYSKGLTQVPDTETHRSPENKSLEQDRAFFFGTGWAS